MLQSLRTLRFEGVAKASLNRALYSHTRDAVVLRDSCVGLLAACVGPETRRACPDQGEPRRKPGGGPHRLTVQNHRMSWDKE